MTSFSSMTYTARVWPVDGCRAYVGLRARAIRAFEEEEATDTASSAILDGCSRVFVSSGKWFCSVVEPESLEALIEGSGRDRCEVGCLFGRRGSRWTAAGASNVLDV